MCARAFASAGAMEVEGVVGVLSIHKQGMQKRGEERERQGGKRWIDSGEQTDWSRI